MRPLNVLFLSSDDLVAEIRLIPLLAILARSNLIAISVVDRNMRITGSRGPFDVCLAHRSPGSRQMRWLRRHRVPLLYDIDDFLLKQQSEAGETRDPVHWCLGHAAVTMAASPRLLTTLDGVTSTGLAARSIVLPNAGRETPPPINASTARPKLIWISSAQPKVASQLDQVCIGIAEALEKLSTGIVLVGRFSDAIYARLPNAEVVPWIAPQDLLAWLAPQSLIAVAPLSTDLFTDEQRFADCKSDIKIAQYGSSGIAGLYSNAMPYADSDLPRRIVTQNDAASWTAAVLDAEAAYPHEGRELAQHSAFATRRPSVLAAQLFTQLEKAASVGQPFSFRAIPTPNVTRMIDQRLRRWLR